MVRKGFQCVMKLKTNNTGKLEHSLCGIRIGLCSTNPLIRFFRNNFFVVSCRRFLYTYKIQSIKDHLMLLNTLIKVEHNVHFQMNEMNLIYIPSTVENKSYKWLVVWWFWSTSFIVFSAFLCIRHRTKWMSNVNSQFRQMNKF